MDFCRSVTSSTATACYFRLQTHFKAGFTSSQERFPLRPPQTSRSYHPFPCCPFRVLGLFPHSAYLESIALGQGRQVWVGVPNRLLTLVGFHTLLHELYDLAAVETGTWGRRRPRRLYFPGFLLSLHFGLCRFFFFCAS